MNRVDVPADAPASHCVDCGAKRPGMIATIVTEPTPADRSVAWICEACITNYATRDAAMSHLQDVFEARLLSHVCSEEH